MCATSNIPPTPALSASNPVLGHWDAFAGVAVLTEWSTTGPKRNPGRRNGDRSRSNCEQEADRAR